MQCAINTYLPMLIIIGAHLSIGRIVHFISWLAVAVAAISYDDTRRYHIFSVREEVYFCQLQPSEHLLLSLLDTHMHAAISS